MPCLCRLGLKDPELENGILAIFIVLNVIVALSQICFELIPIFPPSNIQKDSVACSTSAGPSGSSAAEGVAEQVPGMVLAVHVRTSSSTRSSTGSALSSTWPERKRTRGRRPPFFGRQCSQDSAIENERMIDQRNAWTSIHERDQLDEIRRFLAFPH